MGWENSSGHKEGGGRGLQVHNEDGLLLEGRWTVLSWVFQGRKKKKKAQFLRLPDPGPSTLLSLKAHLPQISCLWGREL